MKSKRGIQRMPCTRTYPNRATEDSGLMWDYMVATEASTPPNGICRISELW
ncbi:uncharacterized protein METZ01_LOCUS322146 [marine metagenome]|uniref:Uncharacterized protein n=1 Tax=marine metagenome TaxID=408172 RepID=A0A382PBJ5_9ZZZZ